MSCAPQVAGDGLAVAKLDKLLEDEADDCLDLPIRVHDDFPRGEEDVADRQASEQLATPRLVTLALLQSSPDDVQLRLTHGALEAQQEAVVVVGRVVQAVLVGQ
jgi:hypothetical protein